MSFARRHVPALLILAVFGARMSSAGVRRAEAPDSSAEAASPRAATGRRFARSSDLTMNMYSDAAEGLTAPRT